jgi:hypothetical protein
VRGLPGGYTGRRGGRSSTCWSVTIVLEQRPIMLGTDAKGRVRTVPAREDPDAYVRLPETNGLFRTTALSAERT